MKKFLIASLFILLCLPSFAVDIPQWSEFCPAQYLNVQSATFNTDKNYWHNRRLQFENSLEVCRQKIGTEREYCYSELRDVENLKNDIRTERQNNTASKPYIRPADMKDSGVVEFGTAKIQTTVE